MNPAVYIMASKPHGTLYIGVTSNVIARVWRHRTDDVPGFTQRYGVHMLVHVEFYAEMYPAICREKQLKKWERAWKIPLISESNPGWRDLWSDLAEVNGDGFPPSRE